MISATFDLQINPKPSTKFQINWPFGSGKKRKIDFQDGRHVGHLGIPIGTILAIFDLQKEGKRKVQGVPQSQTAAVPRQQEEEETDKSKQAQIEQTYEKH